MIHVYLAGLISTEFPQSLEWRGRVFARWGGALRFGIIPVSPMDSKRNLSQHTKDGGVSDQRLEPADILLRDFNDVTRADIILVSLNLWGSPRPMIGTWTELGWAWEHRKPVIAFVDPEDSNYYMATHHPFARGFVTHLFAGPEQACEHIENYYANRS